MFEQLGHAHRSGYHVRTVATLGMVMLPTWVNISLSFMTQAFAVSATSWWDRV